MIDNELNQKITIQNSCKMGEKKSMELKVVDAKQKLKGRNSELSKAVGQKGSVVIEILESNNKLLV